MGERLGGEAGPGFGRDRGALAQVERDVVVVGRVHEDRDVSVILRGGANHCRPTNVNHLDDVSNAAFGSAAVLAKG